jgi:uncharacterized delta-60 repeat protein/uncharacterized repeat protein (TIGR01451 family)
MNTTDLHRQKQNTRGRKAARYARQMALMLVVTALVLTSLINRVEATAGDLDPAFGNGGKVTTVFNGNGDNFINGIAVQPDGKIVAAGFALDDDPALYDDFALARYRPDGALDTSFGSGGKVLTDFNFNSDRASAVTILSDGKILAGGASSHRPALARYNTDGSLDTSFGAGGKAVVDFAGSQNMDALAVQPDGRILLAGITTQSGQLVDMNFTVVRFSANGSLDTTFGSGGQVITDFFGDSDVARAVVVQPDGRIIVAVGDTSSGSSTTRNFLVARYDTDGSLDLTFGSGGFAEADFGPHDSATEVAVQGDGKIIVAGRTNVYEDVAMARFTPDGSLDTSFGSGGKVITDLTPFDHLNGLALYGGEQIIAAGYGFGVARFQGDGTATAADLAVTMSASPSGNTITYTITVNNFGADPSYYVTLKDTLPVNPTFVSFTAPQGWVIYSKPGLGQSGTVSVSKSKMINPHPPFTSTATFTLVVRVSGAASGTTISNRAYVSSSFTPDPYAANDRAISHTSVP